MRRAFAIRIKAAAAVAHSPAKLLWPFRERRFLSWIAILSLFGGLATPSAAETFRSPYAMSPGLRHQPKLLGPCSAPPPPLRDLVIESVFVTGKWNDKVPEREAARRAATQPLHNYLARLASMANVALELQGDAQEAARSCVLRWMSAWAEGGALLGDVSWPEGHYERKWSLIALGEIYLQIYAGQADPPPPPKPVADWLRAMATPLLQQYPDSASQKNNHFYWAGLAAIVAATVLKDPGFYQWGHHRIEAGLADIDPDGFLPLELKRGQYALTYHAASASALVQAAAFAYANGDKRLLMKGGPLERLVHRVFLGLSDPSVFESKTGYTQRPVSSSGERNNLGWVELYYRITRDPQAEPWIRGYRPFNTIWLGGNISDAFGVAIGLGPIGKTELFDR